MCIAGAAGGVAPLLPRAWGSQVTGEESQKQLSKGDCWAG